MNRIRFIIKTILAMISLFLVNSSEQVLKESGPDIALATGTVFYVGLVVLAFAYLHYLIRQLFLPVQDLDLGLQNQLIAKSKEYYSSGFFRGTVGAGYFFVAVHFSNYFLPALMQLTDRGLLPSKESSGLLLALVFVALGEAVKARGLILSLMKRVDSNVGI